MHAAVDTGRQRDITFTEAAIKMAFRFGSNRQPIRRLEWSADAIRRGSPFAERRALLDQLLDAWADTSGFLETIDARWKDRHGEDAHAGYSSFGGIDASDFYETDGNGNTRDAEW